MIFVVNLLSCLSIVGVSYVITLYYLSAFFFSFTISYIFIYIIREKLYNNKKLKKILGKKIERNILFIVIKEQDND